MTNTFPRMIALQDKDTKGIVAVSDNVISILEVASKKPAGFYTMQIVDTFFRLSNDNAVAESEEPESVFVIDDVVYDSIDAARQDYVDTRAHKRDIESAYEYFENRVEEYTAAEFVAAYNKGKVKFYAR